MIEAVVFDWAGTVIDYGSQAPLIAFQRTFADLNILLSEAQIRKDMGLNKLTHIKQILQLPEVKAQLENDPEMGGADAALKIFARFKAILMTVLPHTAALKPGVAALAQYLTENDIPYGTTSGYDAEMLERLLPEVLAQGFDPQVNITAEAVGGIGRPNPAMNRLAMVRLNVERASHVLIVGDTVNDILAAEAAGANSVGIIEGSNLLGYPKGEWESMPQSKQVPLITAVQAQYTASGADVIVKNATELLHLIKSEQEVTA